MQNSIAPRGASVFADGNSMRNPYLVLDTPVVMHQSNFKVDEFASVRGLFIYLFIFCIFFYNGFFFLVPGNVPIMNKKPKIETAKVSNLVLLCFFIIQLLFFVSFLY